MQLIRSFQSRFFKPLQSVVPLRRYLLPIGQWGKNTEVVQIRRIGLMATMAGLLLVFGACSSTDDPAGPAGTSNVVVDLQNLQPSLGALSPTFDPGTQTYEVKVGPTIKELTLTATVADPRVTLKIKDQLWPSGQPYGPIPVQPGRNPKIPLLVEALGLSKDYAVVVEVATTPDLQNLEAAAGPLDPAFDPDKTTYTVATDTNTTSTTITATLVDDTASLTINETAAVSGQPSVPIPLPYGQTPIPVSVQTTDGKTKIYTVTVIRPTPDCSTSLANLTVNQGQLSPVFDPNTENYVVAVGSGVGSLTVTAAVHTNATVKINGQVTTTAQVPLNSAGQSTQIQIEVACPDGTKQTYTIRVDREAPCDSHLTSLTVNQGQLSPAFNPATQNYTVNVGSTVGSITVTASAATAVSINGQPASSLQVPLNPAGQKTTITIVVQCPDGTTKTYTIEVNREAHCSTNLTNLTLERGKVPIEFRSSTLDYPVTVGSTVSSLLVDATKQDANATVEIDGQTTNSLNVPLGNPGTTKTIPIIVRCADGTSKTYRVTVTRLKGNVTLSNIRVTPLYDGGCFGSEYVLMPQFSPSTDNYTVNVGASVTSVCVGVTKGEPSQTVTINGQSTTSRQITLISAGTSTIVGIVVTAADGISTMPYRVTVNRAAASKNTNATFQVYEFDKGSPATLIPVPLTRVCFLTGICIWGGSIQAVNVHPDGLTVMATKEDTNATLRILDSGNKELDRASPGDQKAQATIPIVTSCSTAFTIDITIEVVAQDGSTRRSYPIRITSTCKIG